MSDDIFARLAAPFPPDRVSWRVGATNKDKTKGMALAYIDARDVMERLDEVVGPGCWQNDYPHANGKTVCRIGILLARGVTLGSDYWDGWVWKADGAGDTDHEAEKGALSDAFKRAAVRWGIGRYLYDLDSPWVAIEQRGKSYAIADSEYAKLRAVLGGKAPPPRRPGPTAEPPLSADSKRIWLVAAARIIKAATDPDELAAWWRSPEQSRQRRDFLDQGDVDGLKTEVMDRIALLQKRQQPAHEEADG